MQCLREVRHSSPRVVAVIEAVIKIDDEAGRRGQLEANAREIEELIGKRPPASRALQARATGR